ncbi:MAG: DNA polymerase III subunit delta [bacterium]
MDIPDYIKTINELKSGEVSHIYVLSGDWDFLKDDIISRIYTFLRSKGDTVIIRTESEVELDKEIKNAKSVLIPTVKLIIARLNSPPKLKTLPEDIYVVIDTDSIIKIPRSKQVNLSPPSPREVDVYIKEIIRGLARYYNKVIDESSISMLASSLVQAPYLLLSVWNTLLLLTGDKEIIEEADIREVMKSIPTLTGFQLIDLLERGRTQEALFLLRKEYYPDSEIMQLLSALRKRYKLILYAKTINPQDTELAKFFNISSGYARFILSISRDYPLDNLIQKIKLLLSIERRVKTGELKPKEGLEDFILFLGLSD